MTRVRRWIAVLATLMCCALVPFAGVVLIIPAIIAVAALLYRHFYGREPVPGENEPVVAPTTVEPEENLF